MGGGSAKTIAELRELSDKQLVEQHDELAKHTVVGIDYYLSELGRRQIDRQNERLVLLTLIIGLLTLINVAAVVVDLLS